jgi:hypothetical protein
MKAIDCVSRAGHTLYNFAVPGLLIFVAVLFLLDGLLLVGVFLAATEHLRVEARTGSVEIEFSPGQPIAWALGGARLLDCSQLAQVASRAGVRNIKKPLADEAEIALVAIEEVDGKHLSTVRARVSLHGNDLLVELERLVKQNGHATATAPECSKDARPVAVLDTGDGIRRAISLPAQLRLDYERIGNGLTLEFRGGLRVGNDVNSSRQPLLTSGRLALWEVRSPWLQWLVQKLSNAQFEIESRDLSLGDKVTITAPDKVSEDAPQGFVRIIKGVKFTEMSVYATAVTTRASIVRPFGPPEPPKANWIKRVWADELLTKLAAALVALGALGTRFFIDYSTRNAQDT